MLISGQSLCSGCGSDVMLCERRSMLTNVTRVPWAMASWVALTPADVMVIVLGLPGDGDEGEPLPHESSGSRTRSGQSLRTPDYRIRLRSLQTIYRATAGQAFRASRIAHRRPATEP